MYKCFFVLQVAKVLNLTGPLMWLVPHRAPFSVHCCVCYREVKTVEDTLKLQKDIDFLGSWAPKWGMIFQCNMMQLTKKRINKIDALNI